MWKKYNLQKIKKQNKINTKKNWFFFLHRHCLNEFDIDFLQLFLYSEMDLQSNQKRMFATLYTDSELLNYT